MDRIVVLALAAALAGCATVSSQKPVFPPAPDRSALAGVYGMNGDKGAITLAVQRRDGGTYEAAMYAPDESHTQVLAAEFSAVPLGHGDYVLQASCLAMRKDDGVNWEIAPAVQYWTLAAARPHGDYWLGFNLSDDAANALSAKYSLVHDKDGGLKLGGLAPARANVLFADWLRMQLAEGGDTMLPLLMKHDGAGEAPSAHPVTCRDVAKGPG